ncbi:cytochrome-c peroxidase [Limnovirga soli]|uniref:Cytochrome-c peroxidase n=1 Tax=Limnovirga soli TaxID=2656915 RepID=A0A8J8FFD3_9BACT|nr:cytochrome-c peroxidase [Limnovirga soli]NNV55582.1 cytochrome-c peroxidase [Limnovirga soli]
MKLAYTILFILLAGLCSVSWVKFTAVPQTHPLAFVVPKGWPKPVYNFKQNPLTQEGFQLGRKLFYDGRLSKDGNFSCAACHQQFAAFTTYDHNLSHGYNYTFTKRNAPTLVNMAWQKEFMWDGGINHLDLQPLAPITAPNEMAETLDNVLAKLKADTAYRRMFKAAFGDEIINTQRLTKALSQFVVMMVSANSKYDRVMRGEDSFNLPQRLGYNMFQQKCISCHTPPLFTDLSYRNAGLPMDDYLQDIGRMKITGNAKDSLLFKVPTLRNVQLSFPYGHDGRFVSLLSVLNFYRTAVVKGPTTDSLLLHGIPLSNFEIGQLSAFMYTLTDSVLIQDPRFAPPGYENRMATPPTQHLHAN